MDLAKVQQRFLVLKLVYGIIQVLPLNLEFTLTEIHMEHLQDLKSCVATVQPNKYFKLQTSHLVKPELCYKVDLKIRLSFCM